MMLGNKANNLIKLRERDFNVPQFEVFSLYSFINEKEDFNKLINNYINSALEEDLDKIKRHIESLNITINLNYKASAYSVRSSASIEDGENNSFAGQFDTYLDVAESELSERMKQCFISMFNSNAIEYINTKHINLTNVDFNVIIQEMVFPDYSGVLFTSNPQGILSESVIVCGEGVGENIVLDKAIVTTYYYNLFDKKYYYEGDNDYLSNSIVEELIEISRKMKDVLGDYLDIEFAIKDKKIYILQARRITTIDDSNVLIMDNSNIVESYPGISLPLTISFAEFVYSEVFKNLCTRILKNKKELNKREKIFSNMVGSYNGRLYYKISNWYEIINCLPFSKKIIPIWQEMLGIKEKTVNESKYRLSIFAKVRTYFDFAYEYLSVPRKMKEIEKLFKKVDDDFNTHILENESKEEIIELYKSIANKLFKVWDITLLNDLYTFINTWLVKNSLKKRFDNYEDITNQLISCNSNIESMKPIKELINLAYAKDKIYIEEWINKKEQYIKKYGDRNIEELKLETETFRTNPELLEKKLDDYVSDMNKLKKLYKNINAKNNVNDNDYDIGFWTRHFLSNCKRGIRNREISRLNRSRIFGMVRSMFLRIGEILYKESKIGNIKDVFYLSIDELFDKEDDMDYKEIIDTRKNEYELYWTLPQYNRIIFSNEEFNKHHTSVNMQKFNYSSSELKGIACSSGIVTGEALVIEKMDDFKEANNKILITKMTDPGWVYYIANAKGIVSEKGSLLSHTAIIARELKVPAVVGIKDCTYNIKTGDIISVDGNTGIIKIVMRNANVENYYV